MIRELIKKATRNTRYPKEFIDECAKVCFWVRGYNKTLNELKIDESVPTLSSFLKTDMEGSRDDVERVCTLQSLYIKSREIEEFMAAIDHTKRSKQIAETYSMTISMTDSNTSGIHIKALCVLCNKTLNVMATGPYTMMVLNGHLADHKKDNCKHEKSDQCIDWCDCDGDLEVFTKCKACDKTLDKYKVNIGDIKELLHAVLKDNHAEPQLKIKKVNLEETNDD